MPVLKPFRDGCGGRGCGSVITALTQSPSNGKHQPCAGTNEGAGRAVRDVSCLCERDILGGCRSSELLTPEELQEPSEAPTSGRAGATLNRFEDGRCRAKERRASTEREALLSGIY